MNASIVRTIFFKELLDTFRDRRTLIAMVGVPVVLYPVLFILATQVALVQESKLSETVSRVGLSGADASQIQAWLSSEEMIEPFISESPLEQLEARELDAVLSAPDGLEGVVDGTGTAQLHIAFDSTEANSRTARNRIETAIRDARRTMVKQRIATAALPEDFANPLTLESENIAPASKSTGSILGMILPLVMVVMLGVGAFYPAVDLTAGEKERGTFETLLSTPTSKLEIIFGKFFAVFALSMLTGMLNLISMIVTLLFQLSQISTASDGADLPIPVLVIPPQTALAIFVVLVPLAFFISAVMMTVALMARSFKEAQNYVSPFFLAIVMPASAVAVPGIELTQTTQFVPIANVALLFRDLMVGKAGLDAVFVVFVTTAIYAVLALVVATWMFQREEVVLSDEGGIPLTFNRGRLSPLSEPTLGLSLGIFAIVMLLIFYAGSYAQARSIHSGLLITQFALILAPILFALWYGKVDLRNTLNLHVPRPGAALGTLLIAPAWVIIIIQVSFYHTKALPPPPEMEELAKGLFDLSNVPGGVLGLIFIIAISPAICEEVLFRGLLVSGFRKRLKPLALILVIGVLFGFFHLSVYRLVPTGLTGIVLTYLAVRSGSIYPAMFAHFTLNGLSVLLETERLPASTVEYLESANIEESGLPLWMVGVAAAVFVAGGVIVEKWGRAEE